MEEKLDFLVYCIESYKNAKSLNGKQVLELFNKYGVIDYINSCYDALHTTGREYIIDDIGDYINIRQKLI